MSDSQEIEIPATANNTPTNSQPLDDTPEPLKIDLTPLVRAGYDRGVEEGVIAGLVTGALAMAVIGAIGYFIISRRHNTG
jgi:hypothetical protein